MVNSRLLLSTMTYDNVGHSVRCFVVYILLLLLILVLHTGSLSQITIQAIEFTNDIYPRYTDVT